MSKRIPEGKQEKNLDTSQTRKPYTEPKLTFIEPKLTKYGDATMITSSFLGTFSSDPSKN